MQKLVRKKGNKLIRSALSDRQKLQVINTVITPAVTYAFRAAPHAPSEIVTLSNMMARIAKCCHVTTSLPCWVICYNTTGNQESGATPSVTQA